MFLKLIRLIKIEKEHMLGRWRLEQCLERISHKVDLANEDHCGVCAEYALKCRTADINKEKSKNNELIPLNKVFYAKRNN